MRGKEDLRRGYIKAQGLENQKSRKRAEDGYITTKRLKKAPTVYSPLIEPVLNLLHNRPSFAGSTGISLLPALQTLHVVHILSRSRRKSQHLPRIGQLRIPILAPSTCSPSLTLVI